MVFKVVDKIIEFLKIPIFFILFAYLALWAYANLGGSDYLFHIKAGEYIVTHNSVPSEDVFSFTMEGKKWVDHEWLYQVLIHSLYKGLGLDGLFLLKVIIFSLAFFILSLVILKTDWIFGFPLIFYGLQISTQRFILRPDNFSFLFLILFLLPFIFKKRKLLFALPLIQILWVNIHGFFFFGPAILGIYLLAKKIKPDNQNNDFYNTVKIVFLLTLGACFISPHPISAVTYPFKILLDIFSGNQKIFYESIQELQSPLKHISRSYLFIGYLIFAVVYLSFYKNTNFFLLILSGVMALFCLNSMRNLYFFVPLGIAIFADRHKYVKDFFLTRLLKEKGFIFLRWGFVIFSIIISVNLFQRVKKIPKYGRSYITEDNKLEIKSLFLSRDPRVFPENIINFINNNELPQRMFNNFNLGAPLIFSSFPKRKVFIDGRSELYGKEFFSLYRNVLKRDKKSIDYILDKYKIEGFMISYFRNKTPTSLIKAVHKRGFKCVYFGTDGIIFVDTGFLSRTPALKKHLVNFRTVKFKKIDLINEIKLNRPSIEGYSKKAYILYMLNYPNTSRRYLDEILRINPNHAGSHHILAKIYYDGNDYQKAFIHCRRSLNIDRSFTKAKNLLARIYIKTGNNDSARELLDKLKIDFDNFLGKMKNE